MGPRCSSAETQVCHRSYIIAEIFRICSEFLSSCLLMVLVSFKIKVVSVAFIIKMTFILILLVSTEIELF